MDTKRVLQGVHVFAPPGTPLEAFFKENAEDLNEAVQRTQELMAEGARIYKKKGEMGHSDIAKLFGTGQDYIDLPPSIHLGKKATEQQTTQGTQKPPKPRIPVGEMVLDEAQRYLADLLGWIFEKRKGLKPRQFRKWPLFKDGVLVEEATKLDEWDDELEEICPRNFYKGPHKGFEKGKGPDGAPGLRIVAVCARLLASCGENPNEYAEKLTGMSTNVEDLINQLKGGGVQKKRKRHFDEVEESESPPKKSKKSKSRKKSKKKKSKKSKKSRRRSSTSSSPSSDSSSSSSTDAEETPKKKQQRRHIAQGVLSPRLLRDELSSVACSPAKKVLK